MSLLCVTVLLRVLRVTISWLNTVDDNISHNLPGPYVGELIDAMVHAFRKKEQLGQMLRVRLEKNLHEIVSEANNDMPSIAYEIFQRAEAEGWVSDLILAVQKARPGNQLVQEFYEHYQQLLRGQQPEQARESAPMIPHSPTGSLAPELPPQGNISRPQFRHGQGQPMTRAAENIHLVDQEKKVPPSSGTPARLFYFRGGWCYCSAARAIGHFFSRGPLMRGQNARMRSFLSDRSYSHSLS